LPEPARRKYRRSHSINATTDLKNKTIPHVVMFFLGKGTEAKDDIKTQGRNAYVFGIGFGVLETEENRVFWKRSIRWRRTF
jgi:hypothetical protein